MKVVVASENPVKVNVARRAFTLLYPGEEIEFVPMKSDSGVPDQPMDGETEQGALNRLTFIRKTHPEADFWISQEGGLYRDGERLYNRAWIMVSDKSGRIAKSSTALFYLPAKVTAYVKEGMELGHANDMFFGTVNLGQGSGGIGYLTGGAIDREAYYLQAAVIALSELKHAEWY